MELTYLLAHQDGAIDQVVHADGPVNGIACYGNPGLSHRHAARLWAAFQSAEYVDYYEKSWPNEFLLPRLNLLRSPDLARNPDAETSLITLTWVETEFKTYCAGRRVGFAGAEAGLLRALHSRAEFQVAARSFWPERATMFFHQVRNDGRDLDQNLDLIKEDLRQFVQQHQIDTLFLSLGGGAKILCYELSRELNICALDFGALLRALTYSGSDGGRAARSTHAPFFYRVPFHLFMEALEEVFPDLPPERLLAKAHAQLLLELQQKEVGWTHAAWEEDCSVENLSRFRKAYREYLVNYWRLGWASLAAWRERAGFFRYCGSRNLTLASRVVYLSLRLKDKAMGLLHRVRNVFSGTVPSKS